MLERIVRKAVALGLASIAFLYSADTLTTRQGKKIEATYKFDLKKEKSQEPEYKAEIVVLDKPYLKITGKIKESEEEFRISKSCNLKIREVTEWTDCHKSSFGGYLGYTLAASISGVIAGGFVGALLATDDAGEGAKTFLITFSLATGAGLLYDGAAAIFCPRKIVSSSKKARRAMPRDKQRAHQQKCYS